MAAKVTAERGGFHPNAPDLLRRTAFGVPSSWSIDRGYIYYRWQGHPASAQQPRGRSRIYEHRAVGWELWGNRIRGNHIDHINGDRADNRPENLQLLTQQEHAQKTARREGVAMFGSWVKQVYPDLWNEWKNRG